VPPEQEHDVEHQHDGDVEELPAWAAAELGGVGHAPPEQKELLAWGGRGGVGLASPEQRSSRLGAAATAPWSSVASASRHRSRGAPSLGGRSGAVELGGVGLASPE
jgi:hypothetical protein